MSSWGRRHNVPLILSFIFFFLVFSSFLSDFSLLFLHSSSFSSFFSWTKAICWLSVMFVSRWWRWWANRQNKETHGRKERGRRGNKLKTGKEKIKNVFLRVILNFIFPFFFTFLFSISSLFILPPSVFVCSSDSFKPPTADQMVALSRRLSNRKEEN